VILARGKWNKKEEEGIQAFSSEKAEKQAVTLTKVCAFP
jgi:hypothetical protein